MSDGTGADMLPVLDNEVTGSTTDTLGLKNAILTHSCDAAFHAAGWRSYGDIPNLARGKTIFAVIVAVMWPGYPMMDIVSPPYLISDHLPPFPQHRQTPALIQTQEGADIASSLFYSCGMTFKNTEALNSISPDLQISCKDT
jgi:hypothetical protein